MDTEVADLRERQAALEARLASKSRAPAEQVKDNKRKGLADELEQDDSSKSDVKKSKKRKINAREDNGQTSSEPSPHVPADVWPNGQPRSQKKRKYKSKTASNTTVSPNTSKPTTNPENTIEDQHSQPQDTQGSKKEKSDRFIAFIGNLPFDTTLSALQKHFHAIKPDSIRLLTNKPSSKDPTAAKYKDSSGEVSGRNSSGKESDAPMSKGYAFLEFGSYDRLRTCLKLYHHSYFCADESGLSKGSTRRINVELTAGGGGKGEGRKEKLKVKNERLGQQRERRLKVEKEKREEERKKAIANGEATGVNAIAKAEKEEKADHEGRQDEGLKAKPTGEGAGDVHPERMQMLKQGGLRGVRGGRGGARGNGRGRGGKGSMRGR